MASRDVDDRSCPTAATPEPTSLILMGTGMLGAVAILRRKYGKV